MPSHVTGVHGEVLSGTSSFLLLAKKAPVFFSTAQHRTQPPSTESEIYTFADIESSAKFILVVEKDASFQKLLDDNFCQKLFPCILVTVRCLTPRSKMYEARISIVLGTTSCLWSKISQTEWFLRWVVQGRGVPDVNTRLMLRKLHVALRVPVFALVDGDPHGTGWACSESASWQYIEN